VEHRPIRGIRRCRVLTGLGRVAGGFAYRPPYLLRLPVPSDSRPSFLRPSIAPAGKYRNINLSSIDYAFRPRLRVRLTLGGRTLPRKPWISGGEDSHLPSRYSYLHDHLHAVHPVFRQDFNPACNALLPPRLRRARGFGSALQSRSFSARNHSTSELLRTL